MKNFLIIIFIFILLSHFAEELFSQSSSSLTRLGIGDLTYSYSARGLGMGQLGISVSDPDFISVINPASLYKISKTRIEFSVDYSGRRLSNDLQHNYFGEMDFGGFTIAVPVSSTYGAGVGIGLIPFSNVSYDILEKSTSANTLIGDYSTEYSGRGGLSKFFIGSSFLLPLDVAFGATFDYYFGTIKYKSSIEFVNSSSYSSEYSKEFRHRGIGGTFGLISPDFTGVLNSELISNFRIGAALSVFSKFNVDSLFTSSSLVGTDTLIYGQGDLNIPSKISFGASLVLKQKYLLSLDYSTQAWNNYLKNGQNENLQNASKFSLGFEYRPLRELGLTFWEQIIFRAGLSYEKTQYQINGVGINQYSASVGASMPISFENTLDVAFMYARRGTKESNLFQEDIFKLGIGLSLGELWFIRQDK